VCGRIELFDDPSLEEALVKVAGAHGYALSQHDVVLHGSCRDCA
jgi:Fe2+ or Zn2+ uptake regulation protein